MSLFLSEPRDLTCQSTVMFSQDESDVDVGDSINVCLDSVCEHKDAHPVVLEWKEGGDEKREEEG